jgi:hypothetical protein
MTDTTGSPLALFTLPLITPLHQFDSDGFTYAIESIGLASGSRRGDIARHRCRNYMNGSALGKGFSRSAVVVPPGALTPLRTFLGVRWLPILIDDVR